MLSKYLFSKEVLDVARLDPKHFTRQRTLTLPTVVSFLLSGVRAAVQSELDQFFANLRNRADSVREVTAQAFSQARYKISALVFGDVNQELIRLAEEHLPIPRWKGLRLVAADGSDVRLTMKKDGIRSIVKGMAFCLYLPGIELFLDFRLHEPLCDERQMFFEAIDCLRPDDLLLMDRGFPCRWLVSVLTARRLHFCIRCDLSRGFKVVRKFLQSGQSEQVVVLRAPNARDAEDYECPATPTTVRLVRVVTPNGRVHVVMTSLRDPMAFPAAAFANLYHGRWRIEEAYKRIKHRVQLEHTSGLSWHAARQDFGAKAVCDNLNALAAYVATDAHLDPESSYKINRTLAFDKIKRQLGRWLLAAQATTRRLKPLLAEIALNLQKFVPDRSRPRKPQPKPHLSHAYK
ncbi:IS4 family transposase [Accumulibacter sp.]|jgi:Transposase DDE domain.|uniref:IS4 family transposase n=1 Tax=Accumulibacter sp. TaxID=2053492 RepID=UPI001AD4D047|nr:IS4 family transposase [Accumulibacter sp.]MBN8497453.1 IS4 family transposase [Accumulibacter sp.]MBO3716904.1 IS4 family transposase [Accumulibacter sp.]